MGPVTGESLESRVRTAIAPLVAAVGGELTACSAGQVLPDGGATADTVAVVHGHTTMAAGAAEPLARGAVHCSRP